MLCRKYPENGRSKQRTRRKSHERIKKFGLRKTERLCSNKETRRLFSTGRRFTRGNLIIIYRTGKKQKAGFFASKHIGGAVKRNRVKRNLREAYRMNKEIFKGLEVIFYAQGPFDLDEVVDIFMSFSEGR